MRIQQPLAHWNNFTIPELKEIIQHCKALERLGIAQDEEMMISIERDITLRDKKSNTQLAPFERKLIKSKQTEKLDFAKINKKEQPQKVLLEQTA